MHLLRKSRLKKKIISRIRVDYESWSASQITRLQIKMNITG